MTDSRARRRFQKNRGALVGAVFVLVLMAFAIFAPLFAHHDPSLSDFSRGATDLGTPVAPSGEFWLGTDRLFRDQFVRLAYGARISLIIAFAATFIATVIGAIVGIVSGYYEGSNGVPVPLVTLAGLFMAFVLVMAGVAPRYAYAAVIVGLALGVAAVITRQRWLSIGPRLNADTALMRVVDVGLSFPFLLLVMALAAALEKTSMSAILLTLGLTGWLGTARVVRAKTLQVRSLDFVVASRALGQSTWRILLFHVLPNVSGPLIVIATSSVAQMIIAESVLSYLGAGLSPPTPTWGHMLSEGQDSYLNAPWLLAAPALAILIAVLGFNLVGEGLRDALDPKDA